MQNKSTKHIAKANQKHQRKARNQHDLFNVIEQKQELFLHREIPSNHQDGA